MELNEIISTRQGKDAANDPVTKVLVDVRKLDAKRFDNLYRLREKISQLERQLGASHQVVDVDVRTWLASYHSQLEADLADQRRQFGADLADGLEPLDLKLRGQYPKLHAGLFTFVLDFDKGKCRLWYGPEQDPLVDIALNSAKVVEAVKKQQSQLGSGLETGELVPRLIEAYRHASFRHGEGPLRLTDLLPYMALMIQNQRFRADPRKKNYREYGRADLSYDLYRLRGGALPFRLSIATRQQTRSRRDFLWIPTREDVEGGDYCATIEKKETNQ